jgi:hypothetical protein
MAELWMPVNKEVTVMHKGGSELLHKPDQQVCEERPAQQAGFFYAITKFKNWVMKRYRVIMQSGRKFMVEEWGNPYVQWGNINPATHQLEKVHSKEEEVIGRHNTQITTANGFKNICMLAPGTSPLGFIDALDASGLQRIESPYVEYET